MLSFGTIFSMNKKQSQQPRKKGKKGGMSSFNTATFQITGVTKEAKDYLADVKQLREHFKRWAS